MASKDSEIMAAVLGLCSDSIPDLTTQSFYTPHSDINAFSLPFAQAFNAVSDTSHDEWRQNAVSIGFSVEILFAAASGVADDAREYLNEIALSLKQDPTLGEKCFDCFFPLKGVDETNVRDRVVCAFTVDSTVFEMWEGA